MPILSELHNLLLYLDTQSNYSIEQIDQLLHSLYLVHNLIDENNFTTKQQLQLLTLLDEYKQLSSQPTHCIQPRCELLYIVMWMDKCNKQPDTDTDITIPCIHAITHIVSHYSSAESYITLYRKQLLIVLSYITSRQRNSLVHVSTILFALINNTDLCHTQAIQCGILYNVIQNNQELCDQLTINNNNTLIHILQSITNSTYIQCNTIVAKDQDEDTLYIDLTSCVLLHCYTYCNHTIEIMIDGSSMESHQYIYCMLNGATEQIVNIHIPASGFNTIESTTNCVTTINYLKRLYSTMNDDTPLEIHSIIHQAVQLIGNIILIQYSTNTPWTSDEADEMLISTITHHILHLLIDLLNYYDHHNTLIPVRTCIMRCIALITHYSSNSHELLINDTDSINTILSQGKLSSIDPTIKEWMLFTVRNITLHQPIAHYIHSLKPVQIVYQPELNNMNINVELDESTGKVRVRNNSESAAMRAAVRNVTQDLSSINGLQSAYTNPDEPAVFGEDDFM